MCIVLQYYTSGSKQYIINLQQQPAVASQQRVSHTIDTKLVVCLRPYLRQAEITLMFKYSNEVFSACL